MARVSGLSTVALTLGVTVGLAAQVVVLSPELCRGTATDDALTAPDKADKIRPFRSLGADRSLWLLASRSKPAKGPALDVPAEPMAGWRYLLAALRAARTAMRLNVTSTKLACQAA